MLVQHPTPPQIDYDAALLEMDPDKDVDGLHPVNMGRLALTMPGPVPCTPAGIEALLAHYEIPVAGRTCASSGGAPRSAARWRCCCRRSDHGQRGGDGRAHRRARLARLHAAGRDRGRGRGRARHPAARARDAGRRRGRRRCALRGAQAPARRRRALRGGRRWITPRVGGVGPTTIAMLFRNAVEAAERRVGERDECTGREAAARAALSGAHCAARRAPERPALRARVPPATRLAGHRRPRPGRGRKPPSWWTAAGFGRSCYAI